MLVDDYGCVLRDKHGRPLPREQWDTQNLDTFVGRARRQPAAAPPPRLHAAREVITPRDGEQLLMFHVS